MRLNKRHIFFDTFKVIDIILMSISFICALNYKHLKNIDTATEARLFFIKNPKLEDQF